MVSPKPESASRGLSLRANFSWTFVGNVVYAACQWGMVVILTKLGSPELVGQFALGLAVTAPAMMLANLQLRGIQATDASRRFDFGHYFGLRLITVALALMFIVCLAFLSGYRRETALVIIVMGLAKSVEAISDIVYGLLQQHERMDWIAKSMIIKGPLSLLALSIIIYFTNDVVWGIVGILVSWFLVLIAFDYVNGRRIAEKSLRQSETTVLANQSTAKIHLLWEREALIELTKLALPLGLVMVLISVNTNLPRYIIESYWGKHELGIFAAMAYLMVVGGTMVNALAQASSPRMAKFFRAGQFQAFKNLLVRLILIGFMIGIAGVVTAVVLGQEILTIIYRPEYARQDVFILLMVAAALGYIGSFLGYALTAARYFRIQVPLFGLVVVTTALISIWLIPTEGLLGAAVALIGGAAVQIVFSTVVILYGLRANPYGSSNDGS